MAVGNGKDYHSRYKVCDSAVQGCAAAGWRGGVGRPGTRCREHVAVHDAAACHGCGMCLCRGACKPYCLACQRLPVAFVPVPLSTPHVLLF